MVLHAGPSRIHICIFHIVATYKSFVVGKHITCDVCTKNGGRLSELCCLLAAIMVYANVLYMGWMRFDI